VLHAFSPDPLAQEREILGGGKINVESLLLQAARPGGALRDDAAAKALLRWAAAEREAWRGTVTNDPPLPGRILPSDYLGQQAMVAFHKDRRGGSAARPRLAIPTGLCPPAQGCEERAALGDESKTNSTATRLWQILRNFQT
jgi:hypothetical protein